MDNKYTNTDIFKTTECPSDALLLSYVKETISVEDKRLVEMHLIDCEMCNDIVEGYQLMHPSKISSNIKSIELKIDKAVEAHQNKKIGASAFKWYYAAAAILIIGLTGILYNSYFNSLKESDVAIVTKSPKIENDIAIDTAHIEIEETPEAPTESNIVKTIESTPAKNTESIQSIAIESNNSKIPVQEDVLALSESASDDQALDIVEIKKEEKPQMAFDAESTTKSLSDNSTFGNTIVLAPAATAVQSNEALTNGSAINFTSPATNTTFFNPTVTDGKKASYSVKKESAAKSKFKSNDFASREKNVEEKEKKKDRDISGNANSEPSNVLNEANQLLLQKQHNEALPKFNQYLKLYPKNCEATLGAAQCYELTNQIKEAIIYYTKLSQLKCNKQADSAYLKLSALYIKNNQPQEAKQILQKAMQSKYLDIAEQAKKELDKL